MAIGHWPSRLPMIPHSRPQPAEAEIEAVVTALRRGRLSQGEEVFALEQELSDLFKPAQAVGVASGTAALCLGLRAIGVRPGHKVIIPAYTCNSLYAAVIHAGATPVCADVEEETVLISRRTVAPLVDAETDAVIAPHTCGFTADIEDLRGVGVPVIEDCAQAIGGRYPDGSPLGSKGAVTVLSFYGTKLLPGGEGGACVTDRPDWQATVRRLRQCDEQEPDPRAFNLKMTDISAALVRARLARLAETVAERRRLAGIYDQAFGSLAFRAHSPRPQGVCFRYLVLTPGDVETRLARAQAAGIACRRPVWRGLHRALGGACPRTTALEDRLVSVPLYPGLSDAEVAQICNTLPDIMK